MHSVLHAHSAPVVKLGLFLHAVADILVGLVVKAPASRAADLSSVAAFGVDHFPHRVIPVT